MTTQGKHTPGSEECGCYGSSLHGITYCSLHAAAPRMLEIIKLIVERMGDTAHRVYGDLIEPSRAIIRDVEGESNG